MAVIRIINKKLKSMNVYEADTFERLVEHVIDDMVTSISDVMDNYNMTQSNDNDIFTEWDTGDLIIQYDPDSTLQDSIKDYDAGKFTKGD